MHTGENSCTLLMSRELYMLLLLTEQFSLEALVNRKNLHVLVIEDLACIAFIDVVVLARMPLSS
jgi:hypothetical protein